MSYLSGWRHLSGRISGLVAAGQLYSALSHRAERCTNDTLLHCARVVSAINDFDNLYSASLPAKARTCLEDARIPLFYVTNRIRPDRDSDERDAVITALIMLTTFESEMSFILSDNQAEVRSRSERAFEHLQRSIVADSTIKARWKAAFDAGETACEKLGAVHLLSHGIWAFKTSAEGGRTDLVYQEPIEQPETAKRWAEGLVLTEWKVAKPDGEADAMFVSPQTQAGLYAAGILAGFELAACRYIVVVSEHRVPVPLDSIVGDVTYRHLNIAVDPHTPSRDPVPA